MRKNLKNRRSVKKEKKTVSTPKEEDTMAAGIMNCFISFFKEENTLAVNIIQCIIAFFKLMSTIFSNFSNITVGICLLLALQSAMSHAAVTPSPLLEENNQLTLTSMLASKESGSSFILYPISALETKTYTFEISEISDDVFEGLEASCSYITTLNDFCLEHPSSCQLSTLSIKNAESSIKTHIQTLYSVKRICELPRYPSSKKVIECCHQGLT